MPVRVSGVRRSEDYRAGMACVSLPAYRARVHYAVAYARARVPYVYSALRGRTLDSHWPVMNSVYYFAPYVALVGISRFTAFDGSERASHTLFGVKHVANTFRTSTVRES